MSGPAPGFSVGDFISAISLIKTLISALSDSAGSKPQYQRLIEALFNLERALTEVKNLNVTLSQTSQKIALEQVAFQCEQAIERFLKDNAKFKSTLSLTASSSKWSWRTNLHKIQWAVCKEDAIAALQAEITGYTLTINTLLTTIQLSTTFLQVEAARNLETKAVGHRTVSDDTNALVRDQTNLILSISTQMAKFSTRDQSTDLQAIIHKVLDTNMKIYTMIVDMQKFQDSIPPQIDRQQPVFFEDAHGRIAPFHIEFIDSFEAFQAVLEVRFQHVPGLRKIQNNEYTIQEPLSKRKINLKAPWGSVFLPGRKFNMSVFFRRPQNPASSCPGCQTENTFDADSLGVDVCCGNPECNLWYQRIVEVNLVPEARSPQPSLSGSDSSPVSSASKKRKRVEGEDEDEIHHFRRVQVIHQRPLHNRSSPEATRYAAISINPEEGGQERTKNLDSSLLSNLYFPMPSLAPVEPNLKYQPSPQLLKEWEDMQHPYPRYPSTNSIIAGSTWPMPYQDYHWPPANWKFSGQEIQDEVLFGGQQQSVDRQAAIWASWQEIENAMNSAGVNDGLRNASQQCLGGSTLSGTYLEVLSLPSSGSDAGWSTVNRFPNFEAYLQAHNGAISNPGQTIHLRNRSDASAVDVQDTTASSSALDQL